MTLDVDADVTAARTFSAIPTILEVACRTTGMGFAAVARVTKDRWVACEVLDLIQFGLKPGGELPIETTLCNEVRDTGCEIVIDDVPDDPVYAGHHTPRLYGLRSYISVPIVLSDGTFFGTLCAIDPKPAALKGGPVPDMFRLFADLIARHLDDQRLVFESRAQLAESMKTAELRDQFIAVLGHDLRNPLAALSSGNNLLLREPLSDAGRRIVATMQQTTARMTGLVDNMLDLARGQLAGGIAIDPDESRPLSVTIEQIVAEIRASHPDRVIEVDLRIERAVPADHARMGQLFANLLANAVMHGAPDHPIRVEATAADGHFALSVANRGAPIPEQSIPRLFQPFFRGGGTADGGLGLGLYIAEQIARAHGGRLDVVSDEAETRFTFRMPIASGAARTMETA